MTGEEFVAALKRLSQEPVIDTGPIVELVLEVGQRRNDPATFRTLEQYLHEAVLFGIAQGTVLDPAAAADAALSTLDFRPAALSGTR